MTLDEIKEYIDMIGKDRYGFGPIQLFGFTSTLIDKNNATKFIWENKESGHHKVLFHIKWENSRQHYFLNAGAYDDELEVLLYDGVKLYVHSVEDVLDDNEKKVHTLIELGS